MQTRRAVLAATGTALAGCGGLLGGDDAGTGTPVGAGLPAGSLSLRSPAFESGGSIPTAFTADGADESPPLRIDGVSDDAASLALVLDDPDAPGGRFVHWLLWNVPPDTTELPRGVPGVERVDSLGGAAQGTNGFGDVGYGGPAPPKGDDPHTYVFALSALDTTLEISPGTARDSLEEAMAGHIVASTQLRGTYGR